MTVKKPTYIFRWRLRNRTTRTRWYLDDSPGILPVCVEGPRAILRNRRVYWTSSRAILDGEPFRDVMQYYVGGPDSGAPL